jgi:signal transduction histidine kinase
MINLSTLSNEADQIAALYVLEIIGIHDGAEFDNIVKLATLITGAPLTTLTFLDGKRIWHEVKAEDGADENPDGDCPYELYPFFVTIPLVVTDLIIGHLNIASKKFMAFTERQHEGLTLLAQQTQTLLQMKLPVIDGHTKEFYERILNNIPSEIVAFDTEHKYLFANKAAVKTDEVRAYIIGKDDFEYAAYRNRDSDIAAERRQQFLKVKKSGMPVSWEETQVDREGKTLTHLRRILPVYDENDRFIMAIGLGADITEHKILEEKQGMIMEQLSVQNTQLLDFGNIVSHNLRGPLINMSMLAEFIRETESIEEQKLLVSKLEPVIGNLTCTFNKLIESIQIRQDGDVKSDNLLFDTCLRETIDILHLEIKKTNVKIQANFREAPSLIYPNKYLTSIFYNLVSNAIKYRSTERELSIKLDTIEINGNVVLSVQDNGLGIDILKHKDNIFKIGKIFHRHPDAKGLGLFMTKTQVEAMGGRIWIESLPGQGSTFFVEFVNQYKCR